MKVIGIGEKKTLNPFITACDKFIYLEILKKEPIILADNEPKTISKKKNEHNQPLSRIDPETITLFISSITDLGDDSGWAYLGDLGNLILKKRPDFDPRNYGFSKMLPLIKSMNKFEIDERETGKSHVKHIYIRKK
jgi:Fe-S-cluster formation regulator IscX/YfhJ